MDTEKDYIEEKLIQKGFSEQEIIENQHLINCTIEFTKRALAISKVHVPFDEIIKRLDKEKPRNYKDKVNAISYAKYIFETEC